MAKRGDNKAAKQRRQERERQRRQASANREPGPEERHQDAATGHTG